jgi:hypothetical protein
MAMLVVLRENVDRPIRTTYRLGMSAWGPKGIDTRLPRSADRTTKPVKRWYGCGASVVGLA